MSQKSQIGTSMTNISYGKVEILTEFLNVGELIEGPNFNSFFFIWLPQPKQCCLGDPSKLNFHAGSSCLPHLLPRQQFNVDI